MDKCPALSSLSTFGIRELRTDDASLLLQFYLAFPETDRRFFQPFPPTTAAVAEHVADVRNGRALAWVAVDSAGSIVGHVFIRNLPGRWFWSSTTAGRGFWSALAGFPLAFARACRRKLRALRRMPVLPRYGIGLLPTARGSGVATELTAQVLKAAQGRGIPAVALVVHQANRRAVALYEKMGFRARRSVSQQEPDDSLEMVVEFAHTMQHHEG